MLLPKDWLRLQLTGDKVSEMSAAAGTLWLDVAHRRWSVPEGSPLLARRRLQLADLAQQPLVMMNPDASEFAGYLVGACRNAGFEPNVVHMAKQPIILLALVSAGRGIALLPESFQRVFWPGVVFRALSGPPLRPDVYMASRAKDVSSVVSNFTKLAQISPTGKSGKKERQAQ